MWVLVCQIGARCKVCFSQGFFADDRNRCSGKGFDKGHQEVKIREPESQSWTLGRRNAPSPWPHGPGPGASAAFLPQHVSAPGQGPRLCSCAESGAPVGVGMATQLVRETRKRRFPVSCSGPPRKASPEELGSGLSELVCNTWLCIKGHL